MSLQALSRVLADVHYIYVCGAIAASLVNSMEVLSDCRNDFILLLFLEALFDLLCSSPSCFPYPLPSWRVSFFFLIPWAAEGCLNLSSD